MKISEMIQNLQSIGYEHGDIECWYAVDDEGNGYSPIHFKPSIYYADEYGAVFHPQDVKDEDIMNLRKICIVN